MTYTAIEVSPESGTPVEVYDFTIGTTVFRNTNAERDFTFSGNLYTATPISRSRVISTIDSKDSQVSIELPGDNIFARLFVGIIPGELPTLTIRQLHRLDPASEAVFVFQGLVSTVGFSDDLKQADLACRPLTSASGRLIPRHTWQELCNHTLYDPRCTITEISREENVTVQSVSLRDLTINAGQLSTEAAEFWTNGFIQFGNEFRTISKQTVRTMTLDLPFREDPTGQTVRILPGCDHLISGDCLLVYNNVVNHGGDPYAPLKNPFEGLD